MRLSFKVGFVLFLLVGVLGISQIAFSQEVTAAIVGTVTDPSGAPINGADVVATDTERGTIREVKTNDAGAYNLTRLPVGTYSLKITAQGFQTSSRQAFTLVLNQTARIDVQMKVGQVTEVVQVSGDNPVLQTERAEVSTIIDSETNERLPLATRNYVQLTLLAPGSITPAVHGFNTGDNTASGGRPYINGNREQANNFVLDGMNNNQVSDNQLGFTPTPDAIQEFNLITENASAEFGNFQGGIVNATIKSGTNDFHGDLWEFFRNDKLNSNNWENRFNNAPRDLLRWNMFGGTVGGPVVKNKLFFFFDYQGQRFHHPSTTKQLGLFTEAERGGDFGDICTSGFTAGLCNDTVPNPDFGTIPGAPATLRTHQLYDPLNGNQPFANNVITEAIDPVAQALFSSDLYPTPTGAGRQNNFSYTEAQALTSNQYDIKIDFNATKDDHIFGRYSHAKQHNPTVRSFKLLGDGFSDAPIDNEVIDWAHTFSPSFLNDVRFGINYIKVDNGADFGSLGNFAEQLGIGNGNKGGPGLLQLGFFGGTPSGPNTGVLSNIGSTGVGQRFHDAVIQLSDSVVWTHGRHVVHTGFEFWRFRVNTFYSGNSGSMGAILFNGAFTSEDPSAPGKGGNGYGGADFYLGLPSAYGSGLICCKNWAHRSSTIAGYLQDDWRISNNLTLNLGVRYETFTPWVEKDDHQVNFDLQTGEVLAPDCSKVNLGTAPTTCKDSSRGLYNGVYGGKAFQPRFGFAWTPAMLGNNTVVRGAFTISSYLEGTGTNLRLPFNPPFQTAETLRQYQGVDLPDTRTSDGLAPFGAPTDPFAGALIRVWDPNVQPALTQQWNLTIQHQFGNSATAQIGYVGSHGTHLMVPMPYLQRQLLPGVCGTPTKPQACTAPSAFLSGNPTFQSDISQISGTASVGSMKYNALQAVFQKRYSNGLNYQVAYTFSKCMTDNSGYYGTWGDTQAGPASPYFQNLYDPHADYAPCYFDAKHLLTSYAVYELPFGKGKKFGGNSSGVVNQIAGGWSINPIISIHSGFPIALYDGGSAPNNVNSRGQRPNCSSFGGKVFGRQDAIDPTGKYVGYQWFDPSPYSATGIEQFGNCPAQGPPRGPGYGDVDLSIQKNFHINERVHLQFRTDFVNAFNRVNLNTPSGGCCTGAKDGGSMGVVSTSQDPRNIQFALKLYY
jgi:hypothetical protein